MTDSCNNEPPAQSAINPCAECPWRTENKGRAVPDEYSTAYTREQRVTLWSDLRNSRAQDCHMGAGDGEAFPHGKDPAWIGAGFAAIPEHAKPRECAGSLVAARREWERMWEAGSWEAYHQAHPNGFTKEAAQFWHARFSGKTVSGLPPIRDGLTQDVDVIDPGHEDGMTGIELMDANHLLSIVERMQRAMGEDPTEAAAPYELHCTCAACVRHGEVHAQTELETLAGSAMIDDELVPLVEALTAHGVTTVASCVNLRQVTDALMPGESERVMTGDHRAANYRHTLATGAAFLRFLDNTPEGAAYLERLQSLDGLEILRDPGIGLAHVTFPGAKLAELEAAA